MPPRPALGHRAGGRVREPDERDHVQVDLADLGVDVERVERSERAEARVVHEDVDGARPRLDRGELRGIGEIGGEHLGVRTAPAFDLLGERLEPRHIARDEHDVVAARRQLARELLADTDGRARDQCNRIAHGLPHGDGLAVGWPDAGCRRRAALDDDALRGAVLRIARDQRDRRRRRRVGHVQSASAARSACRSPCRRSRGPACGTRSDRPEKGGRD